MAEEKYCVNLSNFKGPLDLLLHLLEKNKMDIYDIPIAEITKQYLEYLHAAEEMNLEIASDFLLMAATLVSIKAKMLLPKPASLNEAEEADPREELTKRLLEYKFYKEASLELKGYADKAAEHGFRTIDLAELGKSFTPDNPVANISLEQLWQAFDKILQHIAEEKPQIILTHDSYEVEAMMDMIIDLLNTQGAVEFGALFNPQDTKKKVIAVFLALLELYKMGSILLRQDENFGNLWLVKPQIEEEVG